MVIAIASLLNKLPTIECLIPTFFVYCEQLHSKCVCVCVFSFIQFCIFYCKQPLFGCLYFFFISRCLFYASVPIFIFSCSISLFPAHYSYCACRCSITHKLVHNQFEIIFQYSLLIIIAAAHKFHGAYYWLQ